MNNHSINRINVHLQSHMTERTRGTIDRVLISMQSREGLHYASAMMARIPNLGGRILVIDSLNVNPFKVGPKKCHKVLKNHVSIDQPEANRFPSEAVSNQRLSII